MKLVWCPETASKAYIDTVRSVSTHHSLDSNQSSSSSSSTGVAELISAMAGGWQPKLIVETWNHGRPLMTSIGLASANRHTRGRHVCIVPDERSRFEYIQAMQKATGGTTIPQVFVGDVEQVMRRLVGVEFLVVDCRRKDCGRTIGVAKLSHRGAVIVCKNACAPRVVGVDDDKARVVRCVYLPVGRGVQIAHVAIGGSKIGASAKGKSSTSGWFRYMDQQSGEEHVFRR